MKTKPDMTADVAAAFQALPDDVRPQLLELRGMLFEVAASTAGVGEIVETLKWGQPSYLTVRPKSGSTVRLGTTKGGRAALFCHCQTSLIRQFRELYDGTFEFEGNRALILAKKGKLPRPELTHCMAMALTYHRRKAA